MIPYLLKLSNLSCIISYISNFAYRNYFLPREECSYYYESNLKKFETKTTGIIEFTF